MISKDKIREAWNKVNGQMEEAKNFLKENKIDEALYFVWLAAENLVNTLKILQNGYYLKKHREKSEILKRYFLLKILKKDYSGVFKRLSKYRLAAEFHPYTSVPKDYTKEDVAYYLKEIGALKQEIKKVLTEKGIK